ncbi:MAG TPA: protease pro-enzyme activation domain-containing protein, partial [Nannocystis sp.]
MPWFALLALATGCPDDSTPGAASEGFSGTGGGSGGATADPGGTGTGGAQEPTGGPYDPTEWLTTGTTDPVGPCVGQGDPLCNIPPEEKEPTPNPDGLPSPLPGVYDDQGPAPLDNEFRALIGFPTRQRELLEQRVADIYDPGSPNFRKYLTVDEWMADHAPFVEDFELVKAWLKVEGFKVNFEAKNRLLIHFSGTVKNFNEKFNTELRICMRKNPLHSGDPFPVYCTLTHFTLPKFVAARTNGIVTADLPAKTGELTK